MTKVEQEKIFQLSGGHGGITRAILLLFIHSSLLLESVNLENLLKAPAVQTECEKIWESLELAEKRLLMYLTNGTANQSVLESVEGLNLLNRGLLDEGGNFFSTLFKSFVILQDAPWDKAVFLDSATRQVWVLGELTPRLTALEFRLFQSLYQAKGDIMDRYELIQAGWPKDDPGGVSDDALTMAMSRIRRKIEPNPTEPRFLLTYRDQGYQLITKEI